MPYFKLFNVLMSRWVDRAIIIIIIIIIILGLIHNRCSPQTLYIAIMTLPTFFSHANFETELKSAGYTNKSSSHGFCTITIGGTTLHFIPCARTSSIESLTSLACVGSCIKNFIILFYYLLFYYYIIYYFIIL